jgi:hypothetical protein
MNRGRALLISFCLILAPTVFIFATLDRVPENVRYGATFSTLYAEELGLEWRKVYAAMLDDLGVRELRIPAYWPRIEKNRDSYDWRELDYALRVAQEREVQVVLAIGRRVPRWPECHVPSWAASLPWGEQKNELLEYLEALMLRYKDNSAIEYWQVENEAYLSAFAYEHCGDLDEDFLDEEIALVRSLDDRPILMTDSGNLGRWLSPYKRGDAFGTSLYIYFWNPEIGQFKSRLPAIVYRIKDRIAEIAYGEKPTFLVELSLEPWLIEPITEVALEEQIARMDVDMAQEIIEYARRTNFERQYLWGVEWWYYMREQGHPEFWERAKELYAR